MTLSLEDMIEKRYGGAGWIVLRELGNGTGYNVKRHADAVAIGIWPSHGYSIEGLEVKRTRSDVQKELDDPSKADAVGKYCDFWWLVVADLKIIDGLAIPETWGILHPRSQVLRVHRKAPRRKPDPINRAFSAAIIRRVTSEWIPRWQLADLEKKTVEDARARVANESKYNVDNAVRDYKDLKATIAAFEKVSGLQIADAANWRIQEIAEAVKIVIEARTLSGARVTSAYDAPEQLVSTEIKRIENAIDRHDRARASLASARDRLEVLQKSFDDTGQLVLPEVP